MQLKVYIKYNMLNLMYPNCCKPSKYFQRYDVEMACYGNSPPSGQILKGAKRAKKKKDPNAPKRSM